MDPNEKSHRWVTAQEWQWIQAMRAAQVCAAKQDYDTQADADRVAKIQMGNSRTSNLWSYECPVCKRWHLTSHGKKPRRDGGTGKA